MSVLTAFRPASRTASCELVSPEEYTPPACAAPRTLGDWLAPAWGQIRSTPRLAALAAVDGLACVAAVLALRTVAVHGTDSSGPFAAQCGVGSYVLGQGSPVVRDLCREAYTGHAQVLLLAVSIVLATTLALYAGLSGEDPHAGRLRNVLAGLAATPARAAAAAVAFVSSAVAGVAVWPVTVHLQDARGALDVQCGLGFSLFGHGNAVVHKACSDAYDGRLTVLVVCTVAVVVAGVLLVLLPGRASAPVNSGPERDDDDGA